jgi:hypothetical protein
LVVVVVVAQLPEVKTVIVVDLGEEDSLAATLVLVAQELLDKVLQVAVLRLQVEIILLVEVEVLLQ